jgi:hypothetical protein
MTGGNYLNKDVLALEMPHIGYVIRDTENKIIVYNGIMDRYDIPKSEIQNAGRNMLIGLPLYGIVHKYKVGREEELLPIISTTERREKREERDMNRLESYRTY